MCDTVVAVPPATGDGNVWFGKNSDREPGEAQIVEHRLAQVAFGPGNQQCTNVEVPRAERTNEVVLSRPFWMWGAEMGANEHGVAIGNEAVWTRLPVAETGLTGMDFVRLALERASTAREALELITHGLIEFGQGGFCGYRKKRFRYHNSFILADSHEAWVLETAGPHWAAEKVRGIRTISNSLTIGRDFDLLSENAYGYARQQGWCKSVADFNFAGAFGDPLYRMASGGEPRRACTQASLNRHVGQLGHLDFFAVLREHNGHSPVDGWRMEMPCAHASWPPTRLAGQTTGSMVSQLRKAGPSLHWFTGTSSPCLSVFKPVVLGTGHIETGPAPGGVFDDESLFWRHEQLHRLTLGDYAARQAMFHQDREQIETALLGLALDSNLPDAQNCQKSWAIHRQTLAEWVKVVRQASTYDYRSKLAKRYWAQQNKLDRMPVNCI